MHIPGHFYVKPRLCTFNSLKTIKLQGLEEEILENKILKKYTEEKLCPLYSFPPDPLVSENDLGNPSVLSGGPTVLLLKEDNVLLRERSGWMNYNFTFEEEKNILKMRNMNKMKF